MQMLLKIVPIWVWALLAASGAVVVQQYRITVATAKADRASAELATAQAAAASLRSTIKLSRELLADRDQIDAEYAKAITDAQTANDQLVADIAAGRKRVSVNATCEHVRDAADTGTTGSADAGTPRLTPDAEQARADLEYAVEQQREQIIGLQQYIRSLLAGLRKAQ